MDLVMCFPAAPVTSLSDPAEVAALPRRKHLYLGERVRLLLVLRRREEEEEVKEKEEEEKKEEEEETSGGSRWREQVRSLSAATSACAAERLQRRAAEEQPEPDRDRDQDRERDRERDRDRDRDQDRDRGGPPHPGGRPPGSPRSFTRCRPLHTHTGAKQRMEPDKDPLVLNNQAIFFLTVSLDKLPVNTSKVKVTATVWRQEEERVEVREHGYLTLLQLCGPSHTFRKDLDTFRVQVSTTLNVLPPPSVQCQQLTVCGKHLTILKVLNLSSQEEVCVRDVKILPNYNVAFLPVMPDGSVLVVDNVCHQSAEVTMASFQRVGSGSSRLPSMLSALEEHNFLFQLQLQEKEEEESSEGLEVPLVAVVEWYTAALTCSRSISTSFSLPSIRLERPRLLLTGSGPRAVRPQELFWVRYTLTNNLHDFLAVRLVWNSEAQRGGRWNPRARAVVCQSPLSSLGRCAKGSVVSFRVAFQILTAGVFELSQHMRLKLQFTTSVAPPSPQKNFVSPSPSPSSSSPTARELMERRSLGRSQSFSHQPTASSGCCRSDSVEHPGVARLLQHALVSKDKIAKRECQVFVLQE